MMIDDDTLKQLLRISVSIKELAEWFGLEVAQIGGMQSTGNATVPPRTLPDQQ